MQHMSVCPSRPADIVRFSVKYMSSMNGSVLPSVCLSLRPTPWLCVLHRIIMAFSGVIPKDRCDIQANCHGQMSKVKVTEVKTKYSRFRTATPVWIHIWWWNVAQSLMFLSYLKICSSEPVSILKICSNNSGVTWKYFQTNMEWFYFLFYFTSNISIQGKTFSHWLFPHIALCTYIISTHIKYKKYIKSIFRGKSPKMRNIMSPYTNNVWQFI